MSFSKLRSVKQHLSKQNIFPPMLKNLSTSAEDTEIHKTFEVNLASHVYLEA